MLKTYENVEDLALNFTVVDNEFGQAQVRELVPGGKDIAVTNENKIRYVSIIIILFSLPVPPVGAVTFSSSSFICFYLF